LTSKVAPISVVIPAYNAERFIEQSIRSVQAQTLQAAEIIVVADDCSDQTAEIAARLGAIVLEQKKRNPSAARNLGINAATQPWIAFQDADDFWDEEKLAFQWKAIEDCPDAGMISSDFHTVTDGKVTTHPKRNRVARWENFETVAVGDYCRYLEKVNGEFLTHFFLAVPSVLLRRDVFARVGLFDESLFYGQGIEFFARVLARYPLAFVERPLIYQRVHDSNHTRNIAPAWSLYITIVDRMLKFPERYPKGAGEAYREQVKRNFLQAERILARRESYTSAV
jgi:glycosyltransferase involved in cell wall biosynthesis